MNMYETIYEHFKYIIVGIQPVVSDWVYPLRKAFDRSEKVKEKSQ